MPAEPFVLTGQVPVQLDYTYQISCFRVEISEDVPSQFRAGAQGPIGIGQGIGPTMATLSFTQLKGAPVEFGSIDTLKRSRHTLTIGSPGQSPRLIVGAALTSHRLSNDPQNGNTEWTLTFMGASSVDA